MKSLIEVSHVANKARVPVDVKVWSGGEVHVTLPESVMMKIAFEEPTVELRADIRCSDGAMALLMTVDAIRHIDWRTKIFLELSYLPYARQDRVVHAGEAFALKTFARLLNDCKFENIVIHDPHSPIAAALVERSLPFVQDLDMKYFMSRGIKNLVLVSPDLGARQRTKQAAEGIETANWKVSEEHRVTLAPDIVYVDKQRGDTGDIIGMKIVANAEYLEEYWEDVTPHFLVVDDICDGGRTFIELGAILRNYNPAGMHLYVTNGIFSRGKERLESIYDTVDSKFDWTDKQ